MQTPNSGGLLTNRPALTALVFYAAGIVAGTYFFSSAIILAIIAAALTIIGLGFHIKDRPAASVGALYLALFFCGIAQYQIAISNFPPTHIKKIADLGGNVAVVGTVVEEPDIRIDKTYLVVEADSLIWRKRKFSSSGKILIKIDEPCNSFSFQDRTRISGYLFSPGGARTPGGFDYSKYLENKEIFAMMVLQNSRKAKRIEQQSNISIWRSDKYFVNNLVLPVRQFLLNGYRQYLPTDLAALLSGLVLGEKRGIPPAIARLFSDTGTLHLMAVSGSNVAIVAGFFLWTLSWADRRLKILITLLAVVFFSFLTRNEPSVVRATLMAFVGLIGFYRKRHPDMMGLLGFAGLLILIIRPLWLFSIGFQLSVAATAGIIYFVPEFTSRIKPGHEMLSKTAYLIALAFITTASAQLAVLPITAQYFNRLPLIGLIANLPMILLAGILIGGHIASVYAWLLKILLLIIQPMLHFFATLPMAVISVKSPGVLKVIFFYAFVYFLGELFLKRRLSYRASVIGLIAITAITWAGYIRGKPSESLSFIDCEPDRAIIYSVQDARNYLWYDCNESDTCRQIEQTLLPFLRHCGIARIDTVFTGNRARISQFINEIEIGNILQPDEIDFGQSAKTMAVSPYLIREFILNDKINVAEVKSDNNKELMAGSYFFKLEVTGGECILAGHIAPDVAEAAIGEAILVELPWAVQPYGVVFERLRQASPRLLVFSSDANQAPVIRQRERLTYMNERIWATGMVGSFRVRFENGKTSVDHMLKP